MPTFDMVVVGCGGGPSETNLSSYLVKPSDKTWEDGIIGLEAGSGVGALREIIQHNSTLFSMTSKPCKYTATDIYSFVRGFIVSHGHMDHVGGLVLSAGAFRGSRKRVWAARQVLEDLQTVFSDRIWPNLASWDEKDAAYKLLYTPLPLDRYHPLECDLSVATWPVSHGSNAHGTYDSAAFFVRHDPTKREFLFFGDVEPDKVSSAPRNIEVWRAAAPKFCASPPTLSTIFIECSWPSGRCDSTLFGHLTPEHLMIELTALATEVFYHRSAIPKRPLRSGAEPLRKRKRVAPISPSAADLNGILTGLCVYIIHCKDDNDGNSTRELILTQTVALMKKSGLGARILAAEQGTQIAID